MWTQTKSLLTLTEWASILGINPYIVAQVGAPPEAIARGLGQCQRVLYQDGGRNVEVLGREEIAQSLQDAERLISQRLNTFPAPTARRETLAYPRAGNLAYGQLWYGPSTRLKSVRTDFGRILAMGTLTETLVEADVAVVTSDPYTDGFDTFFTASVTVPDGTTAEEVTVYFSAGDIPPDLTRADCEIRPVSVSISGNTATLTGSLLLLINLTHYRKLVPQELDATDSIYVTTIDVYRRTVDPSTSGTLYFENLWWDGCADSTPCTFELETGCFKATDPVQGWVAPFPAEWDAEEAAFSRLFPDTVFAPDRVDVQYLCGYPRVNGRMQTPLAQAVAYLATALLPAREMGCDRADQRIFYYRGIPANNEGLPEVDQQALSLAAQWFGVTGRGAIRAAAILQQDTLHIYRTVHA